MQKPLFESILVRLGLPNPLPPTKQREADNCYRVLLTSPATAPWVIWHCKKKCKRNCSYEFDGSDEGDVTDDDDDGDSEDVAIDFASMVEANGTIEVDVEKLKEALNMDMVD